MGASEGWANENCARYMECGLEFQHHAAPPIREDVQSVAQVLPAQAHRPQHARRRCGDIFDDVHVGIHVVLLEAHAAKTTSPVDVGGEDVRCVVGHECEVRWLNRAEERVLALVTRDILLVALCLGARVLSQGGGIALGEGVDRALSEGLEAADGALALLEVLLID